MSRCKEFRSHPGVRLVEHLGQVGKSGEAFIRNSPVFSNDPEYKDKVALVAGLTGRCHDFGKYTTFFQEYLNKTRGKGMETAHSVLSGLFGAYQVFQLPLCNQDEYKYFPLVVFITILSHHGDLDKLDEALPGDYPFDVDETLWRDRERVLKIQFANLSGNWAVIQAELTQLQLQTQFLKNWEKTLQQLIDLKFEYLDKKIDESQNERLYVTTSLLFSCLVDADKRHASGTQNVIRKQIDPEILEHYKKEAFGSNVPNTLDQIKEEVYQKVLGKCVEVDLEKKIFTLTAPTGVGKTLAGLKAALALRQRIIEHPDLGFIPRIIYALPFTSIIDQNYQVIDDVLKKQKDYKQNPELFLVKHHHLAEIRYREQGKERPLAEALMLTEGWESEIVVTTFFQFFHTLLGYRNALLRKLHNIAGSIIILDEIQNIKVKYWPLVRWSLLLFCKYLNCRVILMTATRPFIFNPEDDTVELLDNAEEYFRLPVLNRVNGGFYRNPRPITGLGQDLAKGFTCRSMIILTNTIRSSIDIYTEISNFLPKDVVLLYLSTNIIPRERYERINQIKDLESKRWVMVCTQVIEAGVDIDSELVIRDIGPIDAIVQAAGRCNRKGKPKKGELKIVALTNDKNKPLSYSVYGSHHTNTALEVLPEQFDSGQFYDLVNNYFHKLTKKIKMEDSVKQIMKATAKLDYSVFKEFRLIEEKIGYNEVFIEIDDEAHKVWMQYEKMLQEEDYSKRQSLWLTIRKDLRSYTLSVPMELTNSFKQCGSLAKLPKEMVNFYYDRKVGFKRNVSHDTWII